MKNIKTLFAALALATGLIGSAQATPLLDGKVVGFTYHYPDQTTPYGYADNGNYLVGSGIEIANVVDGLAQMDISDRNLLIAFLPPAYIFLPSESNFYPSTFSGFVIYDAFNTIEDFTSVTINPASNMAGLDDSRISFDANHIWVNWQGLPFDLNRTVVSLDLNRGHAVPEPASLALVGLGLAAIAASLRRRS